MLTEDELYQALDKSGLVKKARELIIVNEQLDKKVKAQEIARAWTPREQSSRDYQDFYIKSATPWLEGVVDVHANLIEVDGYSGDARVWEQWILNGMSAKQDVIYHDVIEFGYGYLAVLPIQGQIGVRFHVMSPLDSYCDYGNDPFATFPQQAIQILSDTHILYFRPEGLYNITMSKNGKIEEASFMAYSGNRVPVIRIENTAVSKHKIPASPLSKCLTTVARLTDALFTMQMTLKYASWPQKYGTGLDGLEDEEGNIVVDAYMDGLITAPDGDAKFGTFAYADMTKIIEAVNANLAQLAIQSHTPMHLLNAGGTIANVGAESLSSIEQNYTRVGENRKQSVGLGLNLAMRVAGTFMGIEQDAHASVHFRDLSSRSLSQVADAIQKIAGLGMPLEYLYLMLPGFDKAMADDAAQRSYATQAATRANAVIGTIEHKIEVFQKMVDAGVPIPQALKELQLNVNVDEEKNTSPNTN